MRFCVGVVVLAVLVATFPDKLWHWDEFQLVYAVDDFDLLRHQPHPPGYYLFILAGRALRPLVGDAALALRWVSALAVAAFAGLAVGPAPAGLTRAARLALLLTAGAFALLSPLTQRFGVAALSYAAEGAVWLAWLLALAKRPRGPALLALAAAGGLAGGVRPTLALWAAALLALAALRGQDRVPWRRLPALALAGAAGAAVWLLPLLWESGGLAQYRAAAGPLAVGNVWAKSIFAAGLAGWGARLGAMTRDLALGMGGLAPLVLASAFWRARTRTPAAAALDPLLLGAALAFAFYAVVIYDTPGYLMATLLPLAAWTLRAGAQALAAWRGPRQLAAAAGGLALVGAGGLLPANELAAHYAEHAHLLAARFDPVRERFDPAHSVLVTSREYWDYALRHVADELPEFTTLQLARDPYFAVTDAAHPYLVARGRRIEAAGPEPLDLASLLPEGALADVVYMVPFDANEFVARGCGALAHGLPTRLGETLPTLHLRPGWRVEVRNQRLHCVHAKRP